MLYCQRKQSLGLVGVAACFAVVVTAEQESHPLDVAQHLGVGQQLGAGQQLGVGQHLGVGLWVGHMHGLLGYREQVAA